MNDLARPFGVYVHWPFCARKCPYCDFNSHVRSEGVDEARYLAAFQRELAYTAALTGPRAVTSIFLGGGTPSLMAPATVAGVLDAIAGVWRIAANLEVTLEANPGSVEVGRFRGYRAAGVNRVSLGVQSLRDDALKKLGRVHDVAEAKAAMEIARNTFDRFSFDLIYARENQTITGWRAEIGEALALAGGHLSLYQLTIEPETPFARWHAAGKLTIPDDDAARGLYELTQELTERAGLPAYEISNHAAPGEESRHNLLYWRYGEYAGVGPGAHGRLFLAHEHTRRRCAGAPSPHRERWGEGWGEGQQLVPSSVVAPHPGPLPVNGEREFTRHATVTERQPERWLSLVETHGHGLTDATLLSPAEQADEMLLMGLRLRDGLDLDGLARASGFRPSTEEIARLAGLDLLAVGETPAHVRVTPAGRLVLNEIVARLSASLEGGANEASAGATASKGVRPPGV